MQFYVAESLQAIQKCCEEQDKIEDERDQSQIQYPVIIQEWKSI